MPEGPLGGPRPGATCSLELHTTYSVPREVGLDLESQGERRKIESRLEENIGAVAMMGINRKDMDSLSVRVSPAGSVVGVTVMFEDDELGASAEDNILQALDDIMKQNYGESVSRPAQDREDYVWRAV